MICYYICIDTFTFWWAFLFIKTSELALYTSPRPHNNTNRDMFDLKQLNLVLPELEEKGVKKEQIIEAIEFALASAYKKQFGKKGQVVISQFNLNDGTSEFQQIKTVMDPEMVLMIEEEEPMPEQEGVENPKVRFNPEAHMFVEQARLIKADSEIGDELSFPLENQTEFGRIAAQTAKQVIIQKIREAEKGFLSEQFGDKQGQIVSGTVQRVERGTIFVDLGKAEGMIPFGEQIKSERCKTGNRITAYLFSVEEGRRGIFLRMSSILQPVRLASCCASRS